MRKLLLRLSLISLIVICVGGCNSDKPTRSNPPPEPEFDVTGQIYLFRCYGRGDIYNNPSGEDYRCASVSGYSGRVTFVDTTTDSSYSALCDSSGYALRLDSGVYSVIVESSCSFPDTVANLTVNSNDTLDFDLTAEWIPGGSLHASIGYHPKTDSLGGEREQELLDSLITLIADGLMDTASIQWDHDYESFTSRWVSYNIPVIDTMETWRSVQQAYSTMATQDSVFAPHTCQIGPPAMICRTGVSPLR